MMLSQIAQGDSIRQVVLYQLAGRLRKQHLTPMTCVHDASSMMDVQADIPVGRTLRLTRMQPYSHTHGDAVRPGMQREGALHIYCRRERVRRSRKDHKEGVALRVHLMAVPLLEGLAQQLTACGQHVLVALPELVQQTRGALDISKEECDGARRLRRHARAPVSVTCPTGRSMHAFTLTHYTSSVETAPLASFPLRNSIGTHSGFQTHHQACPIRRPGQARRGQYLDHLYLLVLAARGQSLKRIRPFCLFG